MILRLNLPPGTCVPETFQTVPIVVFTVEQEGGKYVNIAEVGSGKAHQKDFSSLYWKTHQ